MTNHNIIPFSLVIVFAACASGGGSAGTGKTPPPPSPAATTTAAASTTAQADLPDGVTMDMVAKGEVLYNRGSCAKCHGKDGHNGAYGPNLTDSRWAQIDGSYPEIAQIIAKGVAPDEEKLPTSQRATYMKPRGGMLLKDEEVFAIAAYVWKISHTPAGS